MAKELTEQELSQVVFSPNEAVKIALDTIESRKNSDATGAAFGLPDIDDYLLPGRPGEMIGILGRSRNYKSGLMQWWARTMAQTIAGEEREGECVVYVTWEQAIDEMVTWDMAYTAKMDAVDVIQGKVSDDEMKRLRLIDGPRRITMPLYLIGHSTQEQRHRPRLPLAAVEQGIYRMLDMYNIKPRMIFLDYLQQIEPAEGEDRRMQVFYNVHRCKDIALSCACPVVVGSQANRESYNEKWGVPPFTSSQESSNFEHTCDKMLGVWYPIKDNPNGGQLDTKTRSLAITENLLILQVMKQKIGPSGKWWPLYLDPTKNMIAPMVSEQI